MTGACLSIVGTPIGNLEDITLRALRVLREADVVLCEDTRVVGKLLAHYEITGKTLVRADAEKELEAAGRAVEFLKENARIAYVSDAGTPGVSDPCARLVSHIRDTLPDIAIEAIPGPSALTAALSISGIDASAFTFLGFVPHKKGRATFFATLKTYEHPVVFFESTHRITKTLEALTELPHSREVVVAKELTKIHERIIEGSPDELLNIFAENPELQKGEFVLIVT